MHRLLTVRIRTRLPRSAACFTETAYGGTHDAGTVYKLTTAGIETILYNFGSNANDGSQARSLPIYFDGSYYGTGSGGGSGTSFCTFGCGTIYRLNRYGRVEQTTYTFTGGPEGGAIESGLTNVNGTLYGTAFLGGTGKPCEGGCGTFFRLDRFGAAHVIRQFMGGGADVGNPSDTLLNVDGVLYGMSYSGGTYGNGTINKITTAGVVTILHSFAGGADGRLPKVC